MNNLSENICDAIEIITEHAISHAKYTKTIEAIVLSCEDQTIGKYKVQYQDSIFFAYSNSSNTNYSKGKAVYVQIPNNDFNKTKIIIGSVDELGTEYLNVIEEKNRYELVGKESKYILKTTPFEICSTKGLEGEIELEDGKWSDNRLAEYLRGSDSIKLSANIKTNLPPVLRTDGKYGIKFYLKFKSQENPQNKVTRVYELGIDNIEGDPYNLPYYTEQMTFYVMDGENFVGVDKITVYCKDFPSRLEDDSLKNYNTNDIFIKDISIGGVVSLSEESVNGYHLTLATAKGTYFESNTKSLPIKAIVKVNSKPINTNSQKLNYYWFVQDNSITTKSAGYFKLGGQGWRCLNDRNSGNTADASKAYEWVPLSETYEVSKDIIQFSRELTFKCAVTYNDTLLTQTVKFQNPYSTKGKVEIKSSLGNKFYFDGGKTQLTCEIGSVNKKAYEENTNNQYSFYWNMIDANGVVTELTKVDTNTNTWKKYQAADQKKIDSAEARNSTSIPASTYANGVKSGIYYSSDEAADKDKQQLLGAIPPSTYYNNKVFNFQADGISSYVKVSCTVYFTQGNTKQLVGSDTITLVNGLAPEGTYNLILNNKDQVFQYDGNGYSPMSDMVDDKITIDPLSFSILNNVGVEISESAKEAIKEKITWYIPKENTLISLPTSVTEHVTDSSDKSGYYAYHNTELNYTIASRYDYNKTNNTIFLKINYKGVWLEGQTNFSFIKQGDNGTNGTKVVCRIVPNGTPKTEQAPMFNTSTRQSNWGNNQLKIQIFDDGKQVSSGFTTKSVEFLNHRNENSKMAVKATLKNNTQDIIELSDNSRTGSLRDIIIKATINYENKTYYAFYPLITKYHNNYGRNETVESDMYIKANTGAQNVLYDSDGFNPKYNSQNSFQIVRTMNENQKTVDVINKYRIEKTYSQVQVNNNEKRNNMLSYIPKKQFDGDTNGYVVVETYLSSAESKSKVQVIYIPIYMSLNRYGLQSLNGWDGNSLVLKEKDNNNPESYVLAPQIGAGSKDDSNRFTGIVMGTVKKGSSKKIGLFGYYQGEQSIFLDSKKGSATFGLATQGQIQIVPGKDPIISSGKYNEIPNGLKINFGINPSIEFKSGAFKVDSGGALTSTSGKIGGWSIGSNTLSAYSGGNKITLSTVGQHAINANNQFTVDFNGKLVANNAIVKGDITAYSGHIGGWTIENNTLSSNYATISPSYLQYGSNFYVDSSGQLIANDLHANNAHITGHIEATSGRIASGVTIDGTVTATNIEAQSGTIGGWTITPQGMSNTTVINNTQVTQVIEPSKIDLTTEDGTDYISFSKTQAFRASSVNIDYHKQRGFGIYDSKATAGSAGSHYFQGLTGTIPVKFTITRYPGVGGLEHEITYDLIFCKGILVGLRSSDDDDNIMGEIYNNTETINLPVSNELKNDLDEVLTWKYLQAR